MLLLMARHGETAANREKRFQGQKDYPLNAKGEQQARCLVAALKPYPLQAVFTSDLSRASRTAALAAGSRPLPIHTHPFFREYSFGIAEGLTSAEVKALYPRWGRSCGILGWKAFPAPRTLPVLPGAWFGHGTFFPAFPGSAACW
jgi:broad specificity phosphatase PhoE